MASDDSRFGVALHALTLMARLGRPVPSQFIAQSVGTHPVWIRESLGSLRDAGLVRAVRGPGGGLTLAKASEEITLADVWRASGGATYEPARLVTQPDGRCVVGGCIAPRLAWLSERMASAVEAELQSTTLAEWAASLGGE